MYIRIGRDDVIKSKDLIAILDQKSIHRSEITKEFINNTTDMLKHTEKKKEPFKTIILTTDKVYFSPLSSATLMKRS